MTKIRYAKGRIRLKKGEYQRSNDTFEYKWTERVGFNHSVRRSVYAKTLEELRIKESLIEKEAATGYKFCNPNLTINTYYEVWKKIKTGIRETTFDQYKQVYNRYVEPDFGHTRLKDLSYSSLVLFYKDLIDNRGISVSSVGIVNQVLRMILDVAVRDDVLRVNPCVGALKGFRKNCDDETKDVKALSVKEQQILEDYLSRPGKYHWVYSVVVVMLYTGMRAGEIGGLRWDDVDFDKNEIHVNHTLVMTGTVRQADRYTLNPPKTKNSNRLIPMSELVRRVFLAEKERQFRRKPIPVFTVDGLSGFVFLDKKGEPVDHRKLDYFLKRVSIAINAELSSKGLEEYPRIHSHQLRHTFATRMREAGADIKATSDIMGHNQVNMTLNTYTDTSGEFRRQEISLLERFQLDNTDYDNKVS